MSAHIRVAIADDHVLFCAGIEMIIGSQPDLEFVGAAHDGTEIVELAAAEQPDVILMDIRMPLTDGITATHEVLKVSPDSRVIVLTTHRRQEAVTHAIDAGAHGFLMKDARPELLLAAIRTVHEGSSVFAPSTTFALIRDLAPAPRDEPDQQAIAALTAREREVYLLAARGLSNAEIAESATSARRPSSRTSPASSRSSGSHPACKSSRTPTTTTSSGRSSRQEGASRTQPGLKFAVSREVRSVSP